MNARACFAVTLALAAAAPARAGAQGYAGYPYTIMKPEPGAARQHRPPRPSAPAYVATTPSPSAKHRMQRDSLAVRGSSGSVLPTPLPRTELIPPEGRAVPTTRAPAQEQGPTTVPGLTTPIPNLPHGAETFQDRASRCAFQQGLYQVPGSANARYMGACLQ